MSYVGETMISARKTAALSPGFIMTGPASITITHGALAAGEWVKIYAEDPTSAVSILLHTFTSTTVSYRTFEFYGTIRAQKSVTAANVAVGIADADAALVGSPSAGSPSVTPSTSPSEGTPSDTPSTSPSEGTPSSSPSEGTPSSSPSEGTPSTSPSDSPSSTPSSSPTSTPSSSPSSTPSGSWSNSPSGSPSATPSEGTPSTSISGSPSGSPSSTPSGSPSSTPSGSPS